MDTLPARVEGLLSRLRGGDGAAADELLALVYERLKAHTGKAKQEFPGLHRWLSTTDVFHEATIKLHATIKSCPPSSLAHFFNLASQVIRCLLIDHCRSLYGPQGQARKHASNVDLDQQGGEQSDPVVGSVSEAEERTRLLELMDKLPEQERTAVNLRVFLELDYAEMGTVMTCSLATARRIYMKALARLSGMAGVNP